MTDLEKKIIAIARQHDSFNEGKAMAELAKMNVMDSDLAGNLWSLYTTSQEKKQRGDRNSCQSVLAYYMGITSLAPETEFTLEKRRTYGRSGFPDIDMDFDYLRRPEIVAYLVEKYGREYVGNIGNVQTFKTKAAVRRAIKVLDPTNSIRFDRDGKEIKGTSNENFALENEILRTLPGLMKRGDGSTVGSVQEAYEEYTQFQEYMDKYPEILRIAKGIEGTVAGFGVHAAGILISPIPLSKIAPLHVTTDHGHGTEDGPKKVMATQFPMKDVERMGLIKFDVLGLSTKTAINWACKYIKEGKDVDIDWNLIPLDDEETLALLHSGKTDGCFQLECVSGNTYISAHYNIEDLYNSWIKKSSLYIRPKSIDLANGCYKLSSISKVVKSNVKVPLYKVKVNNGNEIRVTQKHNFLTPNGWRQLSELKLNNRVLVDTQSCYSCSCEVCGRELRSRSRGVKASKFCKHCSAKTTRNPSRSDVKQRISDATKGRIPWNVEKKYATEYPSLLLALRHYYQTRKGKSFEEQFGLEKALKMKEQLKVRMSGKNNPMFGRKPPHAKGGFRKDLGHYVRSSWEADLARVYKCLNKSYLYEPKTFSVVIDGELLNYTPDFYLIDEDRYVEVKGYMRELDRKKIDAFLEQYHEKFSLIRKQEIAELELEYGDLVDWECGSFPDRCSWQKITSISYERDDYVYDICMQNEFKNYRANGFIVHNSPGMKECLKMIKIDAFDDLVVAVAMYRPGPKDYIPEFAGRKQGRVPVVYPHPLLKEITESTYGILVYQEQIMKTFMALADLTPSDGYFFMEGCAKKKPKIIQGYKAKFFNGAEKQGIRSSVVQSIWHDLEKFAGYSFNMAHSVSYAYESYKTAYLKAHYPTEFISARLSVETMRRNFDDVDKYERDAIKNFGLTIKEPNINDSKLHWSILGNRELLKPLLVKGIGIKAAEEIIKHQPFRGKDVLYSFTMKVGKAVTTKAMEAMKDAGFWSGISKEKLLKDFEQIKQDKKKARGRPTMDLFG